MPNKIRSAPSKIRLAWRFLWTFVAVGTLHLLPVATGMQRFATIGILLLALNELFQPRQEVK